MADLEKAFLLSRTCSQGCRSNLGDINLGDIEYSEADVTRLLTKAEPLACPGLPFRSFVFVLLSSFFCLAILGKVHLEN